LGETGIKSRWGPHHLDRMPKTPSEFVGILDDRNDCHLGSALRTHERIHLADLDEKVSGKLFIIDPNPNVPIVTP
jgi:hypothetical protein